MRVEQMLDEGRPLRLDWSMVMAASLVILYAVGDLLRQRLQMDAVHERRWRS